MRLNTEFCTKTKFQSSITGIADIISPSYSPDGKKIVFSVGTDYRNGAPTHYSLWTVNADGTSPKEIVFEENDFCQ